VSGNVRAALFKNCRDIRVEGVLMISRLRWTLHLLYCDGVVVENCRFDTQGANTDGIDPDSSRNIVVRKCFFKTGDDCIAIKSGKNAEGVKVGKPSENIIIEDCVMERGHGGVSIGSEMSGGVRNVTIRRCEISGCGSGIRLKTRKGRGGSIENITVSDCRINRTGTALLVDMLYRYTAGSDLIPGPKGFPVLRELTFTDIAGEGNRKALSLVGMPDSVIEGITLKNVKLTGGAAGAISNAKGVRLEAVTLDGPVTFTNAEKTEAPEKK
jgi:polygalacturonase